MSDITITDADREAAENFRRLISTAMLQYEVDDVVKAFARHRLAAVAEKVAEIERLKAANGILEDALQEVGDDYPGSSCQEWCRQQVKQARAALKEPSHDEG